MDCFSSSDQWGPLQAYGGWIVTTSSFISLKWKHSVYEHIIILVKKIHLLGLSPWGKIMDKFGRRQSAQLSVFLLLWSLGVLHSMRFTFSYGAFGVYRNFAVFSTGLIWYKTFGYKSWWVIYFAVSHPNFVSLFFNPSSLVSALIPTLCEQHSKVSACH